MRLHSKKTVINYAPEGTPPKSERKKINIALYLYIFGLILFSLYVTYIIYTKIVYVEFSGFVQVPKVVVKSYKDAIVDKTYVKNGLPVKAGDPLFSIKYSVETKLPISARYNLRAQLDTLKMRLNTVEAKLKYITSPDILRITEQISSLKAEIISKESLLKAMQRMVWEKRELGRRSVPLELSTINPNDLGDIKLKIERLKATLPSLRLNLNSLEKERRDLVTMIKNGLLFKKRAIKKNISMLNDELAKMDSTVLKTDVEDIVKSKINGKISEINIVPHQSVVKGDSLAVIIPDTAKIQFVLLAGQKKLKYLHKDIELTLILADGRELDGKLVDIHSAALKYQPELTSKYWPLSSPIVGEIEVKDPPSDLTLFDGLKIKAIVERKLWNIF